MEETMDRNQHSTSNRGFASMDPAKQRHTARKGRQSVAPENRSFSRDHDLARTAGAKGGQASHGGQSMNAANDNNRQNMRHANDNDNSRSFAQGQERASRSGREGGSH